MKKLLLTTVLITTLLLVIGCGGQQYVCADGTTVQDPSQCPSQDNETQDTGEEETEPTENESVPESPPTPEPKEPEEQPKDIGEEVQAFMDKAENKVDSFKFVYVGPPENLPQRTYYVRGNKILVELPEPSDKTKAPPYTHVYLNTDTNSAVGYCEARDLNRCPNGKVRYGGVEFSEYYVTTPYQWLQKFQTAEARGNGPSYEGRETTEVQFTTEDGESGVMYVMEFYGLPGKIKFDDGSTIEFRDFGINGVKEDRVTQPET